MQLKNREEMNPHFMWNIKDIFETQHQWEQEYTAIEKEIEEAGKLQGTLANSLQSLKTALDKIASVGQRAELVYLYAFLQKSGDNGNSQYQALSGKATTLMVSLSSTLAFLEPEILSIPQEKLNSWLETADMAVYHHMIDDIVRGRKHTLDSEKEKMLAMLGEVANIPSETFEMLESVDMTFPQIQDEKGEMVTLTHGNFGVYRESADQEVRKNAFNAYFGEFNKYINTFAAMYAGAVKLDTYYADVRSFDSACHKALFGSNVPVKVYDSLTKAVNDNLDAMEQYINLRKKALGLSEVHMYDLYCPIVPSAAYPMPYEEAKQLVKNALAPLGKDYAKLLDMAYNNSWIDVYENKGKTTGAYSCGVYGVHPYVLLNYTNTLDDAFTLAHELGHAMHSWLSAQKQAYINSDYKITVAEVASTVNEVLLTMYLLKTETDIKRRAFILNHFLEGFRTTVFRQTLFAEFERTAHNMHKNGTPLTPQSLNALYEQLNQKYYKGAVVDELQKIEWARIPHFYNSFYVYQYATGFCSAVAIAKNILETQDPSGYLEFLSTGGSDYPIEELKIAGVDLENIDTIQTAMEVFRDTITELSGIMEKL